MLQDWLYVVKRIEYMINSRILNVKYVDQDFKVLTPNTLIFGFRSDIFPRVVEFEPRNEKLFARVKVLEDQIVR